MANHEVIKHTAAIHISNALTRTQRMTSNILLKNAFKNLLNDEIHKIKVSDLIQAIGFDSKNIKALKEVVSVLNRTQLEWNILDKDKKNKWGVSTLLAWAEVKGGVCRYQYSAGLKEIFCNPNIYARLNLLVQRQFRRGHTLAIWEYLVEFLCSKGYEEGYTEWLSLEAFKKLLGVQSDPYYQVFKRLNNKLIKEPLKEINEVSDIKAEAEYKREKRRVTAIRFKVARKECYQLPLDLVLPPAIFDDEENDDKNDTANKILSDRLISFGFTKKQVRDCLTAYDEPYIFANLDVVEKHNKNKKIENLSAYAMAALKDDYRIKKSPLEVKHEVEKIVKRAEKKKVIEAEKLVDKLKKDFNDFYDSKTDDLIKGFSESQKMALLKEFEDGENYNSVVGRGLKNQGLKSRSVVVAFGDFLAKDKELLKPAEYDFVLWAKGQGHTIQVVEKYGVKKYLLDE